MKKLLAIMLVSVLILAGCSKDTSGPIELRVSTWAGGTELEEFQTIVDKLNEEHADEYQITIESIPADYPIKVQTQASAGQAADIIWVSQELIASYASEGLLVPLDENLAGSELKNYTFNENLLAATEYEDEQYAIPWISNPLILYYNKDIVDDSDEKSLQATNTGNYLTWDQFNTMALKYTDFENEQYGTLINGWPPLEMFMWSYGGALEDETGKLTLNNPESKAGIDQLYEMVVSNPITPNVDEINTVGYTETFQAGNTAFLFGGVADGVELIGGTQEVPFDVGYAVIPGSGAITTTFNYSASMAVTTDSENPEVAFNALEDLTMEFFEWKIVPPVDVTELGYDNYEDYITQVNPSKTGMGATIEESMKISHETIYTAESATNAGTGWEKIYEPILSAGVTEEQFNTQQLIDEANSGEDGE